jgi:hypothetical protein
LESPLQSLLGKDCRPSGMGCPAAERSASAGYTT